jgi:hypothetical protein
MDNLLPRPVTYLSLRVQVFSNYQVCTEQIPGFPETGTVTYNAKVAPVVTRATNKHNRKRGRGKSRGMQPLF